MSELVEAMADARERFLRLVGDVRPELHRYCTRMTGSIFDGEDVVQETLAKAFFALSEMQDAPPLRPWLFRIAHNTALDFVRRAEHRHVEPDEVDVAMPAPTEPDGERVEVALQVFAALPPVQRSALAFKDVLGLSLDETADTMGLSVLAVKSALVRARAKVAQSTTGEANQTTVELARLRRYAHLFNERNWDGLRALFGEETRLEIVSRHQRRGRAAAEYWTRYADAAPKEDLRAEAGWVDGVPVIALFRPAASTRPAWFCRLVWNGEALTFVRDFRHVPYIGHEANYVSAR